MFTWAEAPRPVLAFVGFVGLRWPPRGPVLAASWACIGLRWLPWACVGLRWPALAVCGPLWACIGLRWLLWACVDLRWPSLAAVGLRGVRSCFVVIKK